MTTPSFYWYDYETFGIHPALDRPAQFAGIRTDLDLNIVGDPLLIYNRLTDDYLPDPGAALVTGITPDVVQAEGLIESEFIRKIHAQLSQPATCNTGYNSIRFDDEFTRNTLFRNFYDPYEHEWRQGNSRWDLLDVVRLTRALRPDGIQWPTHPNGKPSNRLEDLTAANNLEHANAHDALSDVYATISIAKLIRSAQPKLFEYAFNHRDKLSANNALNLHEQRAVLHVSGMIPGEFGHTAIVVPIARHPTNNNGVIVLDLRNDPTELEALDTVDITRRIFTPKGNLVAGESRLDFKTVHVNRSPVLVPLNTLSDEAAERLNIDKNKSLAHLETVRKSTSLAEKVVEAMSSVEYKPVKDIDGSLYSGGFFSNNDKQRFAKVREADGIELRSLIDFFDDDRGDEMLFRYRARNFPETLDTEENARWAEHCSDRLNAHQALDRGNDDQSYRERFKQAIEKDDWPADRHALKDALTRHADAVLGRL